MEHLTLNDHKAMGGAGVRTARLDERSEYQASRAPASAIVLHEETTA
jgi:hypothetical protein